jgi:hypothetical protein
MKLIFAKTKRTRAFCAVLSVIMLALAVFAGYYAVGNLLCATESPVLISDTGGAVFLGYYLLAGAYFLLLVVAVILFVVFAVNASWK